MTQDLLTNLTADSACAVGGDGVPALLLAALEAAPDAFYLFDANRTLVRTNPAGFALHGDQTLIGRRCCEMIWHSADADSCVVDRAVEMGERVEVEIQLGSDERSIVLIVQPVPVAEQEALAAIVIARDISDLRRAEAQTIAQRSFMVSVADLTPAEIYALDLNGRITWMNQRAELDDLLMLPGRLFIEFITEACREAVIQNLAKTAAGGVTEAEVLALRTDGSVRDVEINTAPLWKDGDVVGTLCFVRDVTERKRAREMLVQSDKLRAVGELAAGVAHNLNNSLTVIQGRAQLLLMRAQDESASKSLKVITKAVEEGTKTLRRILEFTRREAKQEFVPVELSDLITSSIEIARPKWQSKSSQINIKVQIECPETVYVLGDGAELREVVLNLIFNAVDAMPDGGVMEVGTRAGIDSGCFWVADNGAGMSPETVAQIFEPFFTTKGKRGTGLGLSASHGIITRHKGEIVVVSELSEGTRFEVRLPICDRRAHMVKEITPVEVEGAVQLI